MAPSLKDRLSVGSGWASVLGDVGANNAKERPKSAGHSVRFRSIQDSRLSADKSFDLGARVAARRPKGVLGLSKALGFISARPPSENNGNSESKSLRSEGLSEVIRGRILGNDQQEDGDAEDDEDGVDLQKRIPVLVTHLDLPPFPEADTSFPHFQKTAQSLDRNNPANRARLQGVQSHYERQVEKNPNSFNGLVNLACCLIISNQFGEALGLLKKARKLHRDNANVILNLIICYVQLEAFDAATTVIDSSLTTLNCSQRQRTLLLRFRALCHFREAEFIEATQMFNNVASMEPCEGPPRETRGQRGGQYGGKEDDDEHKAELKRDLFALMFNVPRGVGLPPWGRRHSFIEDEAEGKLAHSSPEQKMSGWQPLRRSGLEELLFQMDKPVKERDIDLCGNLCASLYFFKRLEHAQAVVLLEHAEVRLFQAGEYVVKQNDFSDYMYIILMGSVVIDIKLPQVFGDYPVVVNTLYDGQVFGEMSYFTSGATKKARREASVIAQEESYLLRADPAVYLEVMKRNVDSDQTQKLSVLCTVPFLDFCTNYQLAPLAAHTETKSLRLGDRIVHQGQHPDGCYIIAEGLCTLLLAQDADLNPGKRDETAGHTLEPWEPPLLPNAVVAAVNAGTNREGAQHQPRLAIPTRSVPLVYGRLGPGQFLGMGALSDVRGRCAYPSQVTVQVDSSTAKVYMVTRKSLLHLPEASMNGVLQRLAGVHDPINPEAKTVDLAIKNHHRWCKEKRKAVFAAMTTG